MGDYENQGNYRNQGGLVGSREQKNHGGRRETGEPASRADGNHKTMGDYKNQGKLKITGDHEDQKNPEKQGNYKYHRT